MSGHLLQYLRGGLTAVTGDTLECTADYLTAAGDVVATGAVEDANGDLSRRYIHQFAAQDISAGAATVSGPIMPVAGTLLRAYYVVTEALAATMATGAVQIGIADADGSTGANVDEFTLGTTAANGLLVASDPVGTVVELDLAETAIAAGSMFTVTHVQQAVAGTVVQIIEYALDA